MNKTILMGRLTRDPEVRYAANDSGMAIVRYTLAVDRRRTGNDGQSADFINCVAFGKTGEFAEKYFRKGTKILISGRIQTDRAEGGRRVVRGNGSAQVLHTVVAREHFQEAGNALIALETGPRLRVVAAYRAVKFIQLHRHFSLCKLLRSLFLLSLYTWQGPPCEWSVKCGL